MLQVIVAWNRESDEAFERQMPLVFMGERNRRLGQSRLFESSKSGILARAD